MKKKKHRILQKEQGIPRAAVPYRELPLKN